MSETAARAHAALMALGLLLCAGLTLGLTAGWRWHEKEMRRLAALVTTRPVAVTPPVRLATPSRPAVTKPKAAPVVKKREAPKLKEGGLSLVRALPSGEEGAEADVAARFPAPDEIETLPLQEDSAELKTALAVLEGFWQAQTWQEKVAFVWDAGRVGERMRSYYARQEGPEAQRKPLNSAGRYRINGGEILYFSHPGERPLGNIELAMRKLPGGDWKLDWESYVGAGEMTWQEFKSARPAQPVLMRVFAKLGSYHNYEFMEEGRYLSVQLYDEVGESVAHAFCDRNSTLAAYLVGDLGRTGAAVKGYTVRLAFPPNAQSNHCVWLHEVVAARWLLDL